MRERKESVRRARLLVGASGVTAVLASAVALAGGAVSPALADTCPNAAFRTGPSANLPDCRAYELVSPANADGIRPTSADYDIASYGSFESPLINAGADKLVFESTMGAFPGLGGNGRSDRYLARRTADGWTQELIGPTAGETEYPQLGGIEPGFGTFWFRIGLDDDRGSLAFKPFQSAGLPAYLRRPDGSFDLVGRSAYYPGDELSCDPHDQNATAVDFQWLRNGAPIPSANSAGYTVASADQGSVLQCQVSSTNPGSGEVRVANPPAFVDPVPGTMPPLRFAGTTQAPAITAPTASDTLTVGGPGGQTLSCDPSDWLGSPTFAYQWYRDGAAIAGATSSTYIASAADLATAAEFQCLVTATNAGGATAMASEPLSTDPAPSGPASALPQAPGSVDPSVDGDYISPGADHILFESQNQGIPRPVQLRPDAAVPPARAIYDRTPDGVTHTVSLLPGDVTPTAGAFTEGVSADGSVVLMSIGFNGPLYARIDDADTVQVAPPGWTSAGVSAHGEYAFYANADTPSPTDVQTPADLFTVDLGDDTTTQITNTGDARFVNVSADGSEVYFESPSQIGGQGTADEPNLYLWDRASGDTTFIATLAAHDVNTDFLGQSLVRWTAGATPPPTAKNGNFGAGDDTSRTTPDGNVLVFESQAQLTAYDNAGHTEIYRYDADTSGLQCVSCVGLGPASADATLQDVWLGAFDQFHPLDAVHPSANLTHDGATVVFQSGEALTPADLNGAQDVYRWHDGDVSLISSGQASGESFLYAVTRDASDIVFLTPQGLLPQDQNGATGALYDARVDGGFPTAGSGPGPCQGDACQGDPTPPPTEPGSASSSFSGPGNQGKDRGGVPAKRKHCGKHRKLRHGKCVKKRRHRR
ncbi:MAG: hypothetical protein J2O47_00085 [Acidimicrobiaceae bacterium]|nr:hypothetical protein [Acidimicrobiaceae bacterium]